MRLALAYRYFRCKTCIKATTVVVCDEGVIPAEISCPSCGGKAGLAVGMNRDEWEADVPRHPVAEFYRPTLQERTKMQRVAPKLYDWVVKGGLLRRRAAKQYATPVVVNERKVE